MNRTWKKEILETKQVTTANIPFKKKNWNSLTTAVELLQ